MRTLLVLAENPLLAEGVRAAVDPAQHRVVHRASLEEAEPILAHGLADACLLDVELTSVEAIWAIEKLRRRSPKCPIIIYTGARQWEWEEEAYLQGAAHILSKPVRSRMLNNILARLCAAPSAAPVPAPSAPIPPPQAPLPEPFAWGSAAPQPPALGLLRDFSTILTHSLNAEGLLRQFLLFLREIHSVNRAAIFLRTPANTFGATPGLGTTRRLHCASALGLSQNLLDQFELSFDSGIGSHLLRLGRILRRSGEEIRADAEALKEFEMLGCQVAVPILDREDVLGIALFDGRITGEPLSNAELQMVFHLLEQLGLAVKNIWLHDQVSASHQMMADILRELNSACLVVSRDLAVLHANKAARKFFPKPERRSGELEFSDLPQVVGTKLYQVLKTGSAIANFKYEPPELPGSTYELTIVPFHRQAGALPASALLVAEDTTQREQLSKLEVETANVRLIKSMAERLTAEIGNAMVPLSTHQQLLADRWKDPEFRSTLDLAMADSVKRVTRLVNQMRFLARDRLAAHETFPLSPLIEEAYQEACRFHPAKSAQLRYDRSGAPLIVTGDRAALKHALSEIMINALQANPAEPKVGIRLTTDTNGGGLPALHIEVQDNGAGFTTEAFQKASAPFYTTRIVGLGLGLAVTRKIVETHHGKFEILRSETGKPGVVRISIPLESSVTVQA